MLATLVLLIFPLLMAYAASSDLLTMRIANWLALTVAAAYFLLALLVQLPLAEIGTSVAAAAIVLVVSFAFFAFGWIGGGDAKLISAIVLWMGFSLLLPYILYAALLGGALTLVVLGLRSNPITPWLARFKWIEWLHNGKAGVPYGVALAIAALLVYPQTPIYRGVLG